MEGPIAGTAAAYLASDTLRLRLESSPHRETAFQLRKKCSSNAQEIPGCATYDRTTSWKLLVVIL
jgi:hypothetical protein